jgi:hypothetical protein
LGRFGLGRGGTRFPPDQDLQGQALSQRFGFSTIIVSICASAHERTWSQRHRVYTELSKESVAIDETINGIIESGAPKFPKRSKASSRKPPSRRRNAAHAARA